MLAVPQGRVYSNNGGHPIRDDSLNQERSDPNISTACPK